jgi:branched-subunit amino acid transport protein AzlD
VVCYCPFPQVSVLTTVGFTKEAPMVNVHGYNIYHKNRLIMVTIGTILYSDEKVFDKWFSTAYHNLPTMLS